MHPCGHGELIPPSSLLHGLRLPSYIPVLDLEPRLRCRECNCAAKGSCRSGELRVSDSSLAQRVAGAVVQLIADRAGADGCGVKRAADNRANGTTGPLSARGTGRLT